MDTINCPFCNLAPEKIIYESELSLAFYDGFPVSPGHTLIISKRHEGNYFLLTDAENADLWHCAEQIKKMLDEKYHPDGYNIGINVGADAGQSVFHVHMHLIPRYHGDVDNPRGGVRGVIPGKQKY
ncbi:MAG: HIT family protein [Bacteroidales bacterium]|nr:HIT family protein [Bacteroidales bacterium]